MIVIYPSIINKIYSKTIDNIKLNRENLKDILKNTGRQGCLVPLYLGNTLLEILGRTKDNRRRSRKYELEKKKKS